MDKKIPPRCQGQEFSCSSRKSDGTSVSNFRRLPRIEAQNPSNSSNSNVPTPRSQDNSQIRRPPAQKNKDKRNNSQPFTTSSSQRVENRSNQEKCEMGSLQAPGSKKQNFNHLLNFHFAPRERPFSNRNQRSDDPKNKEKSIQSIQKRTHDKNQFLQANCQFYLKEGHDYSKYQQNPDILVDWELIEQISFRTYQDGVCPICLQIPAAGKMTQCGHIFCWPCMLHYLALTDNSYANCPICYEHVLKGDYKSVVFNVCHQYEDGDMIDLQLMYLPKVSSSAYPYLCTNESATKWNSVYSKHITFTPDQVLDEVLKREHDELSQRYHEDMYCPEVCFIEQAFRELEERTRLNDALSKERGSFHDLLCKIKLDKAENGCWFYQPFDGQNLFISSINMAMLRKEYGEDVVNWPRNLTVKIIEIENFFLNIEHKKRLKFLRHLPLGAYVQFADVELTIPIISPDTYHEFLPKIIEKTNKRRMRLEKEEKIQKKLLEKERKKKLDLYGIPPIIESPLDFPTYDFSTQSNSFFPDQLSPSWATTSNAVNPSSSFEEKFHLASDSSFAKIVSQKSMHVKKSPTFPVSIRSSSSSETSINLNALAKSQSDEGGQEDYSPPPAFRQSLLEGIDKMFQEMRLNKDSNNNEDSANKGKKKGRKKGKVLFSIAGATYKD